jgi:hypothetical protein
VRDDDELRLLLELVEHPHVAPDVLIVERRVDLVQQAEGTRLRQEDAEQQRQRHEVALAARQEVNALRALAARRRMDLDVAIQRRVGVLELEVALATAEQRHEDLTEVLADLRERRHEQLARGRVDLADRQRQRLLCRVQIRPLRRKELEALQLLLVLLDRQRVHRTERVELRAKLLGLVAQLVVLEVDRGD